MRDLEARKLLAPTEGHVDIMLSHDWPAWVELFGDHEELHASKPTWLASAKGDGLGSKPAPSEFLALVELDIPPRPHGEAEQYHTMDAEGKYELHYDEEWIAITRAYNEQVRLTDPATLVVPPDRARNQRTSESIAQHRVWVSENIASPGLLKIPQSFIAHAPVYSSDDEGSRHQPIEYSNQQTAEFAELLEMENKFAVAEEEGGNDAGSDGIEFGWD